MEFKRSNYFQNILGISTVTYISSVYHTRDLVDSFLCSKFAPFPKHVMMRDDTTRLWWTYYKLL